MAVPEPTSGRADPAAALPLAPVLDFVAAATLQTLLQQSLNGGRPMLIDASEVERVGTSCLQLLVAAARGARGSGLEFRICAASAVFRDAVADLGLAAELHS